MEGRSRRDTHAFLALLASALDPVLGLSRIELLMVDLDGDVYLLHFLFSILTGV